MTSFRFLDFVQQKTPRQETIEPLLAGRLAFHLEPGRTVNQHYAGRGLVDILAAVTARPDERLVQISLPHAQAGHPLCQLVCFLEADRE